MHSFPTPGPTNLRIEFGTGSCHLRATDTDTTTVELVARTGDGHAQDLIDRAVVEQHHDEVVVLLPKAKGGLFGRRGEVEATIVVPTGSNVDAKLGSADLDATGRLGNAKLASGSGDVSLEEVADAIAKTGAGDLRIATVSGSVSAKTGSADVEVGRVAGTLDFLTGSGDIMVKAIEGTVRGKAGSGDISIDQAGDGVDILLGSGDLQVARIDHGQLKAKTGSGDVSIGVANGTAAFLDIMTASGQTRSSLEAGEAPGNGEPAVELSIRSGSGDVVLRRA